MLLTGRAAVIFGGSGAIGSVVTQAMAHERAHVCLGARSQKKLDRTANIIRTAGGTVETFITSVLDEYNVSKEVTRLVEQTGGTDVVANATEFMREQGKRINALSLSEFVSGVTPFPSAQFNIAEAATPHMNDNRAGVVLSVVTPTTPMVMPGHLSHIVGYAGTRVSIKALIGGAGSVNIRAVDIRSHAIVGTIAVGSYTGEIFFAKTQSMGLTVDRQLGGAAQSTMLVCLPMLA